MALPKSVVPTYEDTIPSNGKKIKYRPFLVKEEKLLLLTMQNEPVLPDQIGGILFEDLPTETKRELLDAVEEERVEWEKEVERVVKDTLKSCIQSRIKLEDLASFDLEYLFIKIRARSSGEDVNLKITCKDDNKTVVNKTIDLLEVEVVKPDGHDNKIMLSDELGVVMRYPSVDAFIRITLLNNDLDDQDELSTLIAGCIDQMFDSEDVYDDTTTSAKEKIEFLDGLTNQQFAKLNSFFDTMPYLAHRFKATNPETGVESDYELRGLQSFFG